MSNDTRRKEAKGRNSFVVYDSWAKTFEQLSDEEAGRFIKAMFEYSNALKEGRSEDIPVFNDRLLDVTFTMIQDTMVRDYRKYCETCEKRANNKPKASGQGEDSEGG